LPSAELPETASPGGAHRHEGPSPPLPSPRSRTALRYSAMSMAAPALRHIVPGFRPLRGPFWAPSSTSNRAAASISLARSRAQRAQPLSMWILSLSFRHSPGRKDLAAHAAGPDMGSHKHPYNSTSTTTATQPPRQPFARLRSAAPHDLSMPSSWSHGHNRPIMLTCDHAAAGVHSMTRLRRQQHLGYAPNTTP
jgi:hypothetical protein